MKALWLLATLFILYGTTLPLDVRGGWTGASDKLAQLPLSPLVAPDTGRRVSIPDVAQNVLLFMPFGAFGWLAGRRRSLGRTLAIIGLGAILSATVEGVQLFSLDRTSSVSDVVSDTLGTFAGIVAAWIVHPIGSRLLARAGVRRAIGDDRFASTAILTTVVALLAWAPFDITLDVSTTMWKVHALRDDIWQVHVLSAGDVTGLILTVMLGTVATAWLAGAGRRRPALEAALAGVACAAAIEAVECFVARTPGLMDLSLRTFAFGVGVAVWSVARERAASGTVLFAVAATAAAVATFDFHGAAGDLVSMAGLAGCGRGVLAFVPMGFFASRLGRRSLAVLGLTLVWLVCVGMTDRTAAVLLQAVMAVAGVSTGWIARRLEMGRLSRASRAVT